MIGSSYTRPFCPSFDLLSSQEKFYYSQLKPNLYISKCITFDYLQWIVVIPPSNVTKEQEYIFAESIFKEWLLKSFQGRLHYSVIVFPISFSSKNSSCKHFQGLWIKASFNSIISFKKETATYARDQKPIRWKYLVDNIQWVDINKAATSDIVVKNTKSFIYLVGSKGKRIEPWATLLNETTGPPPNSACNIK